jgi:hypothetical protein
MSFEGRKLQKTVGQVVTMQFKTKNGTVLTRAMLDEIADAFEHGG